MSAFAATCHAEWIKIRSVRSSVWLLVTMMVLLLGIGGLLSGVFGHIWETVADPIRARFDPTGVSLAGLPFAALAVMALGALVITGEYRTGMIRTTFLSDPVRLRVLAGKATVIGLVALVTSTASAVTVFFIGQTLLAPTGLAATLDHPGVLRAVLGAGLYLTATGLFGLAIGALLRSTAGALVTGVALLYVLPQIVQSIPLEVTQDVAPYVTSTAGIQIAAVEPAVPGAWTGLAVYCAWITAAFAAAAVLLNRRDA